MTVTLFTLDGTRMETDRVLEASADWQAGRTYRKTRGMISKKIFVFPT